MLQASSFRSVLTSAMLATLLGACHSDFVSSVQLPEDCDRSWFFEDRDGDGWGRAGGNAQFLCQADDSAELQLTARNNLDCDDGEETELPDAAAVTGRTAAICPDELVANGAAAFGLAASGSEFVAVLPTLDYSHIGQADPAVTELIWPDGAGAACGATGWGGGLATFANSAELSSVTDELDGIVGDSAYAAWVGLVPEGTSWRWEDLAAGEGPGVTELLPYCDTDDIPDPGDVVFDPGMRLALIHQAGGDWCFGFPDQANAADLAEGEFGYDRRSAHFLCEREPPQASDFEIDRDPNAGSDEG